MSPIRVQVVHRRSVARRVGERLGTALEDAREWSRGRFWPPRALVLLAMAWIAVHHVGDPLYQSFLFGGVTLGVHELGHLLFGWGPRFLMVAGGTLCQLTAPVIVAVGFVRQRDYFALTVAFVWLAASLHGMATYIGDARALELPLVTVGSGDAEHDWSYMLDRLGLLHLDGALSALTRVAAHATALVALAWGVWITWGMARSRA